MILRSSPEEGMTHYWVVGGEYADTTFERTAGGGPEERIGPFESYDAAKAVWQARAWATVDNARARYRIELPGASPVDGEVHVRALDWSLYEPPRTPHASGFPKPCGVQAFSHSPTLPLMSTMPA